MTPTILENRRSGDSDISRQGEVHSLRKSIQSSLARASWRYPTLGGVSTLLERSNQSGAKRTCAALQRDALSSLHFFGEQTISQTRTPESGGVVQENYGTPWRD